MTVAGSLVEPVARRDDVALARLEHRERRAHAGPERGGLRARVGRVGGVLDEQVAELDAVAVADRLLQRERRAAQLARGQDVLGQAPDRRGQLLRASATRPSSAASRRSSRSSWRRRCAVCVGSRITRPFSVIARPIDWRIQITA